MKRSFSSLMMWAGAMMAAGGFAKGGTIVAGPGDAGLRAAIQTAQTGDTVVLPAPVELTSFIRIDKRLTIRPDGSSSGTVTIKGSFAGEMFQIAADGIAFEQVVFEGSPQTDGLRTEKELALRDCSLQHLRQPLVDNFETAAPHVIRLERVTVTLNDEGLLCGNLEAVNSTFSWNGLYGASTQNAFLDGCTFEHNEGSGFALVYGTVKNCTFRFNKDLGLFFEPDPGFLYLSSSLFQANEGGGLLVGEEAVATVDNCTFTLHNGPPAVMVREPHEALFRHCTVVGNTYVAPGGLPGYPNGGAFAIGMAERVELQNCLVADNPQNNAPHAAGIAGVWTDGGGNVMGVSARLGTLAANGGPTLTLLPQPGSPAINAGHLSDLLVDARGLSRLAGTAPDAGAVETGASAPADHDADGLPDLWEAFHGLNSNNPADSLFDSDGDGRNALAEFNARTDPADPKSVFRLEEIGFTGGAVPPAAVSLQWNFVPGLMYEVQSSEDLLQWHNVAGTIRPAGRENGRLKLQFETDVAPSRTFYRVVSKDDPFATP
jgi:hypothetical protein